MEQMHLTFVNVGYGEAILAECPGPSGIFTLLIDGGSAEAEEYAGSRTGRIPLAEYLRQRDIRRLDLLVSTHIHEDHVSGLLEAVDVAPPRRMWQALPAGFWSEMKPLASSLGDTPSLDKFRRSLNDFRTLCQMLTAQGCEVQSVSAGLETELCPGLTARVLGPDRAHIAALTGGLRELYGTSDPEIKKRRLAAIDGCMNNYSVVLLLNHRGSRVLLPGDTNCVGYAGMEPELRADLLKLGHHGQRDSVTPGLLDSIVPRHTVCCASSDRRYHSADPKLLELLRSRGIRCWFSDCPEGETVPPHSALTFVVGPGGKISGSYR